MLPIKVVISSYDLHQLTDLYATSCSLPASCGCFVSKHWESAHKLLTWTHRLLQYQQQHQKNQMLQKVSSNNIPFKN